MGFADRYVQALSSSNLVDDALHHQAEPLVAAGLAAFDVASHFDDLGPLLHRVKYADSPARMLFEGNAGNLAQLLRLWTAEVIKRGRARKWVPENTAWDADAAQKLYRRVAEASLAYWLDSNCQPCGGTGVTKERRTCTVCKGSGGAEMTEGSGFVRNHILDMSSELHEIAASHCGRANGRLRSE